MPIRHTVPGLLTRILLLAGTACVPPGAGASRRDVLQAQLNDWRGRPFEWVENSNAPFRHAGDRAFIICVLLGLPSGFFLGAQEDMQDRSCRAIGCQRGLAQR